VAWAAFAAALLTKELAVAVPLALFTIERVALGLRRPVRERLADYGPMLGLLAGVGAVRLALLGWPAPEVPRTVLEHLCGQAAAWTVYAQLWVLPVGQSVLHDLKAETGALAIGLLVAWLALLGQALVRARRAPATGAPLLAAGVVAVCWQVPASLVPLKEVMAEHHAYLSGLALAAAVAGLLPRAWPGLGLAAALVAATIARNALWSSEVRLWTDAAAKNPASADAAYGAGDAYRLAREWAEAERWYRRVLELRPRDANAQVNLGIVAAEQGRPAEAEAAWTAVLRDHPRACAAHNNLGGLAVKQGRLRDAASWYGSALRWCPRDPVALFALAEVDESLGQTAAAAAGYERYLEVVPLGPMRETATARLKRLRR
jgi:tetratricopeptide (TPR) repeat protein